MYCRNCGKEVLSTDKFCANCGFNFQTTEQAQTENIKSNIKSRRKQTLTNINNLPMNWWNFWCYVRFPLSILLMFFSILYYLPDTNINPVTICAFLLDFSFLSFALITYLFFLLKDCKIGYILMNIYLVVEAIYFSTAINLEIIDSSKYMLFDFAIGFVLILTFWCIAWVVPNYIYFKNRKSCFSINE